MKNKITPLISVFALALVFLVLIAEYTFSETPDSAPNLAENYKGYIIFSFEKMFYGVNQVESHLKIDEIKYKSKLPWFFGSSSKEVESKIDAQAAWLPVPPDTREYPVLLEHDHLGYDIVKYHDVVYAIKTNQVPHSPVDIGDKLKLTPITDNTVSAVVRKIEASKLADQQASSPLSSEPPILEELGYHGYNIIWYAGLYYGLHQSEGPMDIQEIKTKAKLPWAVGNSLDEVKSNIDKLPPVQKKPLLERISNRLKRLFGG